MILKQRSVDKSLENCRLG